MSLKFSSLPSKIQNQIKNSFIKSKSQQWHKWSVALFSISIVISVFSLKYIVSWVKKHILPAFTQKLGFGMCPQCKQLTTDIVLIPCNHFSHCYECELKRTSIKQYICSVCNNNYDQSIKIYL